ncbi:MAG: hypothetical protein Kow0069_29470 [Promethearchaeota archaeon]
MMMPFKKEFAGVWKRLKRWIAESVTRFEIDVLRMDELKRAGHVMSDMIDSIKASAFCVADITGFNPNVMWEAGYCEALGKPVIYLSQDLENVPFDLRHQRIIQYSPDGPEGALRREIQDSVRETLAYQGLMDDRYRELLALSRDMVRKTMAVTGSMVADARVKRRVSSVLSTFLGKNVTWLCGSNGDVDEHAARFLAGNKEDVQIVGYAGGDLSPGIEELVKERGLTFVNAEEEKVPKLLEKGRWNKRDLIFLSRADLVILFQANGSPGTGDLVRWFIEQEKDVLVSFV